MNGQTERDWVVLLDTGQKRLTITAVSPEYGARCELEADRNPHAKGYYRVLTDDQDQPLVLVLELDKSGLPKGAPAGLNLELIRDAIEPQTIWDLQGRKRQQSIWWFRAEPLFNDRFTYEQVNGEIDRRRREVEAWAHR